MFIGYGYVVVVYFTEISVRNNFAYIYLDMPRCYLRYIL